MPPKRRRKPNQHKPNKLEPDCKVVSTTALSDVPDSSSCMVRETGKSKTTSCHKAKQAKVEGSSVPLEEKLNTREVREESHNHGSSMNALQQTEKKALDKFSTKSRDFLRTRQKRWQGTSQSAKNASNDNHSTQDLQGKTKGSVSSSRNVSQHTGPETSRPTSARARVCDFLPVVGKRRQRRNPQTADTSAGKSICSVSGASSVSAVSESTGSSSSVVDGNNNAVKASKPKLRQRRRALPPILEDDTDPAKRIVMSLVYVDPSTESSAVGQTKSCRPGEKEKNPLPKQTSSAFYLTKSTDRKQTNPGHIKTTGTVKLEDLESAARSEVAATSVSCKGKALAQPLIPATKNKKKSPLTSHVLQLVDSESSDDDTESSVNQVLEKEKRSAGKTESSQTFGAFVNRLHQVKCQSSSRSKLLYPGKDCGNKPENSKSSLTRSTGKNPQCDAPTAEKQRTQNLGVASKKPTVERNYEIGDMKVQMLYWEDASALEEGDEESVFIAWVDRMEREDKNSKKK